MAGTFELSTDLDHAVVVPVNIPTGGVTEGEVLAWGADGLYGFVMATAALTTQINTLPSTEQYSLVIQADQVTANKDSASIDQGSLVYWTGTAISETQSTGAVLVGYCLKAAAAAATTVEIYWNGAWPALV